MLPFAQMLVSCLSMSTVQKRRIAVAESLWGPPLRFFTTQDATFFYLLVFYVCVAVTIDCRETSFEECIATL